VLLCHSDDRVQNKGMQRSRMIRRVQWEIHLPNH
jgi:hypothetical protein